MLNSNVGKTMYDVTIVNPADVEYTVGETYFNDKATIRFSGASASSKNCQILQVTGYRY